MTDSNKTSEYAGDRNLTTDYELVEIIETIDETLRANTSSEDANTCYAATVRAFAISGKEKSTSPLIMANHHIIGAIVFDAAIHGNAWDDSSYETVSQNARTITNTIAIAGLVASHLQNPENSTTRTREALSNPNSLQAYKKPNRLIDVLRESYIDDTSWKQQSLSEIALDGAFLTSMIYARAARSGSANYVKAARTQVLKLYDDFYLANPDMAALRKRTHDELGAAMSGMPNDLIDYLAVLEEDGPLTARAQLKASVLSNLYNVLEDLADDPVGAKTRMKNATDTLLESSTMPEFLDRLYDYSEEPNDSSGQPTPADRPADQLELRPMELNWEVLPPGELEGHARNIVSGMSDTKEVTVDLARLKTLADIRIIWGKDNCYYARGKLGKRHDIRDGETIQPDEYIILVLQDRNLDGQLLFEHAIAESPVVGPHAMYLFRQDVNESANWQEIMALPKFAARSKGARPVKHITDEGIRSMSMVQKAELLLACTPDEFRRIKFNGIRGFRLPKDVAETEAV